LRFVKVRNFCQGQPLLFIARHGRQKNSYAADNVHVFATVTIEINFVTLMLSLKIGQ
jgi:hypothetical protein